MKCTRCRQGNSHLSSACMTPFGHLEWPHSRCGWTAHRVDLRACGTAPSTTSTTSAPIWMRARCRCLSWWRRGWTGGYRLSDDARAAQWLRTRREHGDAIVLHGYDAAATKIASARVRGAARSRGQPSADGSRPSHGAHRLAHKVVRTAGMAARLLAQRKRCRAMGFGFLPAWAESPIWCARQRRGHGWSASAPAFSPSRGGVARWCCPPSASPVAAASSGSPFRQSN